MTKPNFHHLITVGLLSQLFGFVVAQNATEKQLQNRAKTISLGIVK